MPDFDIWGRGDCSHIFLKNGIIGTIGIINIWMPHFFLIDRRTPQETL